MTHPDDIPVDTDDETPDWTRSRSARKPTRPI